MKRKRWKLFLDVALVGRDLSVICSDLGQKSSGLKEEKISRIVRSARDGREILDHLDVTQLVEACDLYGLSESGSREQLISRLLEFVDSGPIGHLDNPWEIAEEIKDRRKPASGSGKKSKRSSPGPVQTPDPIGLLEISFENVLRVLESATLPARLGGEKKAQSVLQSCLAERFGWENVGRELAVGGFSWSLVDIDIGRRFAIEVKLSSKICKSAEIERLLGQIVMYSKSYERENIFAVIAGPVPSSQAANFAEIRRLVADLGAKFVHVA